mgnify:CR=1 FL=1
MKLLLCLIFGHRWSPPFDKPPGIVLVICRQLDGTVENRTHTGFVRKSWCDRCDSEKREIMILPKKTERMVH